jgi:DNA-binding transcriptional LysR family regulator
MPHFARFQRRFPAIELHLAINNSFMSLTQREADIAIRGTNRPPENLIGRRIGFVQTALYASHDYLARLGPKMDFSDYTWIGPDDSLSHLDSAKWLRKTIPADRVVMRVDSLVGIANAVSAGVGVALLLCPLGDERSDLVRLSGPFSDLDTQIWILTHPDLKQMRRVRVFIEHMVENFDTRLLAAT